jgi:small subunit ribosomal protein S21
LAYIEVNPGESFDSALRRFKRKVQQEAIIKDIKKHNVYVKPGEKKRLKIAAAKKRMRKRIKREYTGF